MNTQKTLLAILVEELPGLGGWPEGMKFCGQSGIDNELYFYRHHYSRQCCDKRGIFTKNHRQVGDYCSSLVTRDQYESALEASKEPLTGTGVDGWIDWAGGECPVVANAFVDVKQRDNWVSENSNANGWRWKHVGDHTDIIAYRLHQPEEVEKNVDHFEGAPEWAMLRVKHKTDGDEYFIASMDEMKYQSIGISFGRPVKFSHQHWDVIATREPQDANSRANDDRLAGDAEQALREVASSGASGAVYEKLAYELDGRIGQQQEDITLLTHFMLDEIRESEINISLDDAYELAQHLISVGYRKQ